MNTSRCKGIAKPITPPSKSASEEDSDPEQAQRDKEMQKNLALIAKKPKRAKDYTYHKEKMLIYKQAEKGVPLRAEQSDLLDDTDEEIDEQELEAHLMSRCCTRSDVASLAQIRRIFLDRYAVLDVRTIFFGFLHLSSRIRAF
ncbi:hypothetical protein Tco_1090149 [Tanacetum coccineum]|uniref:Uncharacterized protein n=1 Tax=Tanacetum coccineum TaxID=301880 RepID=A0ABQ5I4I8_9ASTR